MVLYVVHICICILSGDTHHCTNKARQRPSARVQAVTRHSRCSPRQPPGLLSLSVLYLYSICKFSSE